MNNLSIDTTKSPKEIWNKPEIDVVNIKELTLGPGKYEGEGSDGGYYAS